MSSLLSTVGATRRQTGAVPALAERRVGFLTKCATSVHALEKPITLRGTPSAAARRVNRLHRGVDRWAVSLDWKKVLVKSTTLLTFTVAPGEEDQLWGEWQRLMHSANKTLKRKLTYFVWAELTKRGVVHYHMAWVNAPWLKEPPAKWLTRLWGHGNVDQSFRGGKRSLSGLVNYVRGYVKKQGAKAYQQDYAELPPGMRAFNSNLKGFSPELLDAHIDRWQSLWTDGAVVLTGRIEHVHNDRCRPEPGQLEQAARKARYRRGRELGRLWTNSREVGEIAQLPIKGAKPAAVTPAQLRAMQTELFSEYWEWHRRVVELPW